jgi:hypothetical protein
MVKVVLTVLLLFAAPSVFACSCVFPSGSQSDQVRREFNDSSAVFSAYVQSIYYATVNGQRTRMAKLRVMQVWKGNLQPNTRLNVVSDDAGGLSGCSYIATRDQTLLVYLQGQQEPCHLVSCSLTGPLDRATPDIPLLNRLSKRGAKS